MKINILFTFGCLSFLAGMGQQGTSGLSGNQIKPDTILPVKYIFDTTGTRSYSVDFHPAQDSVNALSPYFDHDICEPGNYLHRKYIAFKRKADSLTRHTRELLIYYLKEIKRDKNERVEKMLRNLDSIGDIRNCVLTPVPLYSLAFNIAQYKAGDPMKRYFTLDTSGRIFYAMTKNGHLIALLKWSDPGNVSLGHLDENDSSSYEWIISMRQRPISLDRDCGNASIQHFGFVKNDLLYFTSVVAGTSLRTNTGTGIRKVVSFKEYHLRTAENSYLRPLNKGNNGLKQAFSGAYMLIKARERTPDGVYD